jgi:WD40 repeat protein
MVNIKEQWAFHFNEPILGIEIGDVNNNSQNEIVAFSKSGKILILSMKGKLISELEIAKESSIWDGKICDIDSDKKNEFILGGLDGLLRVFKCSLSYELKPFWAHQFGASISGFLFEDINNDNIDEIIAYSIDKSLRVLNPINGSLIWGQIFEDGIGDAIIYRDSADFGTKEVIACGNDGSLRVFKGKDGDLVWFKRFKDKIRCVSIFKSKNREMVVCGGDDKKLHFIDKLTQEEIKSIQFDDYVWKCFSFLHDDENYLLVSTYSFEYFDESLNIEDIEFSSKLMCLNQKLEIKWEIAQINTECLIQTKIGLNNCIVLGTTKGKLLFIDEVSGKIITKIQKKSCINDLKYDLKSNILIACHDNGSIFAYFLAES